MLNRLLSRRLKRTKDEAKPSQKSPEIIVEILHSNNTSSRLRGLIDSGSTGCIVRNEFIGDAKLRKQTTSQWTTKGGNFTTTGTCALRFKLPDFSDHNIINFECHVDATRDGQNTGYDIILGKDLQQAIGLDILNSTLTLRWEGIEIPMRDFGELANRAELHWTDRHTNDSSEAAAEMQARTTRILDAHYEKADLEKVVSEQGHLSQLEQKLLLKLLRDFEELFDGTLGEWRTKPVSLELKAGAKPYHAKAFPIPQIHELPTKKECERMCKIGVLRKANESEWAAPAFIIPKKNGTVRFLSDFRKLNAVLKRKPYPIPKIQDMLQKLVGFQYATALDLNMGYWTIRLDSDAQKLCTIILPWGKYEYLRLPMGISGAPDIFQEKMSSLMAGLEFVRTYLDDCLVISSASFEDHLSKLRLALERIKVAGLRINAEKSFFGRNELEYLGYWVTREGIMPLPEKVNAMLKMKEPTTRKQLRGFVGLVNFYRDMWRRRSHALAPLTTLCSNAKPWVWGDEQRKAFEEAKKILSKEAILAFPDFEKEFVIYTDASKLQLGGVITQNNRPLAFYSRKLNDAQTRYTTTERELLSIVETLKEFRNILLGHKIIVYTDHSNLTFENLQTDRVLRWRLLLEEYGVEIRYIKGVQNIVADILSRYPTSNNPLDKAKPTMETQSELFAQDVLPPEVFPMNFATIAQFQQRDRALQSLVEKHPDVSRKTFRGGEQLICMKNKIFVPEALRKHTVEWYHTYLLHPGETRTEETIAQHLYWPNMRQLVGKVVRSCHACQTAKGKRLKYGKLPLKDVDTEIQPWRRLCVDTIGPYTIRRKNKKPLNFQAVTMIDPATGWFEMQQLDTKRADEVANKIETTWLTRYPRPEEITFDGGPEFKREFKELIEKEYQLKAKPSSVRNPRANAIIERVHGVVGDMIRTTDTDSIDEKDKDPFIGVVSAVCWAIRSTFHTTLQATPGQLVFGRDMIFNIKHQADWQLIRERKRSRMEENNERENKKRLAHDYAVGDKVLVEKPDYHKMEASKEGPYTILRVHANGTLTILMDRVQKRLNIRQCTPYVEANE